MSRLLKALQQIESGSPQPEQGGQRLPSQEPDLLQPFRPAEAACDDATIETMLERVEAAAAAAGRKDEGEQRPQGGEAAEPSRPQPTDAPTISAGSSERPEVRPPSGRGLQWPGQPTEAHVRAYGELADKLLSQLPSDAGASLLFTSPCDGDGKTGMLVALAAALVERIPGEVLMVDANLRKPALARCLGVEATRGLAHVLVGITHWHQVVRSTAVEGLRVLPGVEFPTPDGRPPGRLDLEPLLKELDGRYRLVLIDTASLAHPEVAPIAGCCTGTYLVVRLGHTTRRAVGEAVDTIRRGGGRLLGSVVLGG